MLDASNPKTMTQALPSKTLQTFGEEEGMNRQMSYDNAEFV